MLSPKISYYMVSTLLVVLYHSSYAQNYSGISNIVNGIHQVEDYRDELGNYSQKISIEYKNREKLKEVYSRYRSFNRNFLK